MSAQDIMGSPKTADRNRDVDDRVYDLQVDRAARERLDGGGKLVITPATEIQERAAEWVWTDRLPLGTLSLAAGKGSSGKSMFAAWLAAQITQGGFGGCWKGKPRGILWVTLEASPEIEVKPRLLAAGADIKRCHFATVQVGDDPVNDHTRIFNPDFLDDLYGQAEALNIGMIVLDPLLDTIPERVKKDDQVEVRAAIGRINLFAEETGVLVLGLAHFNKMTSVDDAIDRITGSAAFSQRVRAALVFGYNDEDQCFVVSQGKSNWGPTELPHLAFNAEVTEVSKGIRTVRLQWADEGSEFSVSDILARKYKKQGESKAEQVAGVIVDTLSKHSPSWVPRTEVETAIEARLGSVSQKTLTAAKQQVGVESKRALEKHGPALWRLPC